MIIGIADFTFLAAKDFKPLLHHLSPYFKFAVSYRLLNRITRRYPYMKVPYEELKTFIIRRLKGVENIFLDYEKILSNILWGIKKGALITIGFDPLCDLELLRRTFNLSYPNFRAWPLFAYDVGNIFMSKVFDVPLWAESGIITSLTKNYPRIFKEYKEYPEVEFPIEMLSEDTLNPLKDYIIFFSKLKSEIQKQVPPIRIHKLLLTFNEEMKRTSTYWKGIAVNLISAFIPNPDLLIRLGLVLTSPILIFVDGIIRKHGREDKEK